MQKVTERNYCVFAPQGFVTKCFLIFIVDEVKNFAANIFFKLVCQSRIGSRASLVSHVLDLCKKGGVHILKSSKVLKWQKVSAVSSSTRIVEFRDKSQCVSHVLDLCKKGGVHILKSSKILKRQKVSAVSSSTRIVESRDKSQCVSHMLDLCKKGGVHILKSSKILKQQKVSAVSSSMRIVESRDKSFVLNIKLLFTIVDCFLGGFPLRFFTVKLVCFIGFPKSSYLVLFIFPLHDFYMILIFVYFNKFYS